MCRIGIEPDRIGRSGRIGLDCSWARKDSSCNGQQSNVIGLESICIGWGSVTLACGVQLHSIGLGLYFGFEPNERGRGRDERGVEMHWFGVELDFGWDRVGLLLRQV